MIRFTQIDGHTAGNGTGGSQFCKAQTTQDGHDTTDDPAKQCQTKTEVGTFQNVAAQIIDAGTDGHTGNQADATKQADDFFQLSSLFLFFHKNNLLSFSDDNTRNL